MAFPDLPKQWHLRRIIIWEGNKIGPPHFFSQVNAYDIIQYLPVLKSLIARLILHYYAVAVEFNATINKQFTYISFRPSLRLWVK